MFPKYQLFSSVGTREEPEADFFFKKNDYFLQFVPGKSLKQILQEREREMKPHERGLALHIIKHIASSLLKTLKFMNSNEVPHERI
jgi:hypothetical protein